MKPTNNSITLNLGSKILREKVEKQIVEARTEVFGKVVKTNHYRMGNIMECRNQKNNVKRHWRRR